MQTLGSLMVLGGILALSFALAVDLGNARFWVVCGCAGVALVGLILSITGRHSGHPI
jgi:hypothetical protein